METRNRRNPIATALYLNAALLAVLVVVLLGRNSGPNFLPQAFGQNQLPIGGGAGVFIVPAQFNVNSFGCYLMDIDNRTIWAYQYQNSDLKLVAARNFENDRHLGNYNTTPAPHEIGDLVEKEKQAQRVLNAMPQKPVIERQIP